MATKRQKLSREMFGGLIKKDRNYEYVQSDDGRRFRSQFFHRANKSCFHYGLL